MTIDSIDADFGPPLERTLAFDANAHARPSTRPAVDEGAPADRAFEGAAGLAEALHQALAHANAVQARRVCWCDADFAAWPLGEPAVIDLITHWARGGARELVMVAAGYEAIERRHPRFVAWRRDFSHQVRCLVPEASHATELPTLWIDSAGQAVRMFDREHLRGRAGFGRVDRQQAREDFDAIAQRAAAAFATVTLGL
jgi:hypothetical protein